MPRTLRNCALQSVTQFLTIVILAMSGAGGIAAQELQGTINNRALAVGDLNGDGLPDIVAGGDGPFPMGEVAVLFGAPGGTFQPASHYAAGGFPVALALGDVTGDGLPDIVVSSEAPDELVVLAGAGNNQFFPAISIPTGEYCRGVAVGDLNGDAFADAAVAASLENAVYVHPGDAAGSLGAGAPRSTGEFPHGVVLDDLDGDGKTDLAVTNLLGASVSVFQGIGDGTFGPETRFAAGFGPHAMIAGDFNLDGHRDLATANRDGGTISVLLGNGQGGFSPEITTPLEAGLFDLATGDFDGNGVPDIAAVSGTTSRAFVLTGAGNGRFALQQVFSAGPLPAVGYVTWDVLTADFDADGILDLAWGYLGLVKLAGGRGDGTFVGADMDGDGIPDTSDPCIDIDRDGRGDPGYPSDTCAIDNCPLIANINQVDLDLDGFGNACDNCPAVGNPRQEPAACSQAVTGLSLRYNNPQGRGSATVSWQTTGEFDIASFNVIENGPGGRVQLNTTPLACHECSTGNPSSYAYLLGKHQRGRDLYVELIHNYGPVETYGPAPRD